MSVHEAVFCGEGSARGCGQLVEHSAKALVNHHTGHVLFHPACFPAVATVPAFRKGLEAELYPERVVA